LWWYLSQPDWSEPNLIQLNEALTQSGWTGTELSRGNWRSIVRESVAQLDWQEDVLGDIQAFIIITADWKRHLNIDALIALLA
jgi:sensor domain CHASE-containing protein